MKKLLYLIPLLLIVVVGFVAFWPPRMMVAVTDDVVSINIGSGIQYADTPGVLSDWTIKFESTGTHVKGGYLKIRLDFYPSESSKIYPDCYVLNEESGLYQLNPALCHFVRVPVSINKEQLTDYIKDKFNLGVVSTLDEILIQENRAHLLSAYFGTLNDKLKYNEEKAPAIPSNLFIPQVNDNLSGLSVSGSEKIIDVEPPKSGSIDVGPGAINRTSTHSSGYTVINFDNPSNDTGVIDTGEVWATTNIDGFVLGTFYEVADPSFTCRDSESIGAVTSGSKQTFVGLTINVNTSDYLGSYFTSGTIERDTTGFGGYTFITGEYIDPGDNANFGTAPGDAESIYATGTESGGTVSISNAPSSKAFGVIWSSSTYWSNTGNSTGFVDTLDDAEAFFTLTNDGDTLVDVSVNGSNWSGGVGWTIVQAAPGSNEIRESVFAEGDGTGDNVTLTTSPQAFISGLAASATIDWELKLETGSAFTDGVAKTTTITLIASAT